MGPPLDDIRGCPCHLRRYADENPAVGAIFGTVKLSANEREEDRSRAIQHIEEQHILLQTLALSVAKRQVSSARRFWIGGDKDHCKSHNG